jgi:uncharacterized membrane protein YphA (DoxX/SURF4 family)
MPGAILLLLGLVFALAGASKLLSPDAFRATLRKLVPASAVRLIVVGLPVFELLLGAWLISGVAPRQAAGAAVVVLLGFCAVLFRIWRRGLTCGCFGEMADSAPSGLARNVLLIAMAAYVALPDGPVVDGPWSAGAGNVVGRLTVVLGAACLWPCLVALVQRRKMIFSSMDGLR